MANRTKVAEERLERLDNELNEADAKMRRAISDYADAKVAWALQVVQLSKAIEEDDAEAEPTAHISADTKE